MPTTREPFDVLDEFRKPAVLWRSLHFGAVLSGVAWVDEATIATEDGEPVLAERGAYWTATTNRRFTLP